MKVILSENMFKQMMLKESSESINIDDIVKSSTFTNKVKELVKDELKDGKDNEKIIKKAVAKCVSELFKSLWQRDAFWRSVIENS